MRPTVVFARFLRAGAFREAVFRVARAFVRDAFFGRAFFFVVALLRVAFFFVADFFRLAFFFDGFLDVAFFLVTLAFLADAFFRGARLAVATFLREEATVLRFLLGAFLAGIGYSCRSEKNAELYIACADMEAQKSSFFQGFFAGPADSAAAFARRL